MRGSLVCLLMVASLLATGGCATLVSDFEEPTITVSGIRAVGSDSMAPRFEIDLHIVNPNRTALTLHGMTYRLKLQGYDILTGVARDLPTIEGYSEGDVTLTATADMLSSLRWLASLMRTQRDTIDYALEAKLDLGGFHPMLHINKKGEIKLSTNEAGGE